MDTSLDVFDLVRQVYNNRVNGYSAQKEVTSVDLDIFRQWIAVVSEHQRDAAGSVLELGCGSCSEVAERCRSNSIRYKGIDLSETQINWAKSQYNDQDEEFASCFEEAEMLEFCSKQASSSYLGVVSLFSIFHLPRARHVELFIHIKRILKKGAPLLFTIPPEPGEGLEAESLGGTQNFWSNFSVEWYELTLKELDFELVSKYKENVSIFGSKETTWWLLFLSN